MKISPLKPFQKATLEKMVFSQGVRFVALLPQKLGRPLIKRPTTLLIKDGLLIIKKPCVSITETVIKRIKPLSWQGALKKE
jgi:hypothetical protein